MTSSVAVAFDASTGPVPSPSSSFIAEIGEEDESG